MLQTSFSLHFGRTFCLRSFDFSGSSFQISFKSHLLFLTHSVKLVLSVCGSVYLLAKSACIISQDLKEIGVDLKKKIRQHA